MLNQEILGMVKSVKVDNKTTKNPDGTKTSVPYTNIKLESADIDYPDVQKFNPSISATLLNIQPMPFKSINFGEQTVNKLSLKITLDEGSTDDLNFKEFEVCKVQIRNLSVIIKENIPTYIFDLMIPINDNVNNNYLSKILKRKICFEFYEQ